MKESLQNAKEQLMDWWKRSFDDLNQFSEVICAANFLRVESFP